MKRIAIALVVSAAAAATSSARADTRVHVGVNIGGPAYYRPAPVIVSAPAPSIVYAAPPRVVYASPPAVIVAPSRGFWKEVQVRTWVPERWVVRPNRWGRPERFCAPGYYTYHTDRVWVDGRPDHGRGDAHGAYGYSRDNRGYGPGNTRGWNR